MMINNVIDLMRRLRFPQDAIADLSASAEKILNKGDTSAAFNALVKRYEDSETCDYMLMLEEIKKISQAADLHEYSGNMVLFLALGEKLRERYQERGLPDKIYYDTLSDLKYKNEECRLLYGINGTFVAPWFPGFFMLKRFALGKLQFELTALSEKFEYYGTCFNEGTLVINIHIPRTGSRLYHEEALDAYRQARDFFQDEFSDQPILFACHSWLLYPWNETVLSKSSNLYAFFKDFKIISSGNNPNHEDAWRLFDCVFSGDAEKLPRDSSLRRAYADRIAKGEPTGWGLGVFSLDQILKAP